MKFLRSANATNILRSKAQLSSPVHIQPYLTPEERTQESLYLKERRSLIDKGVDRKQIKLRNWDIYIDDKPHCKIVDRKLKFHSAYSFAPLSQSSEVESPSPVVTNDQRG